MQKKERQKGMEWRGNEEETHQKARPKQQQKI
jgi:hypothetical protein